MEFEGDDAFLESRERFPLTGQHGAVDEAEAKGQ